MHALCTLLSLSAGDAFQRRRVIPGVGTGKTFSGSY